MFCPPFLNQQDYQGPEKFRCPLSIQPFSETVIQSSVFQAGDSWRNIFYMNFYTFFLHLDVVFFFFFKIFFLNISLLFILFFYFIIYFWLCQVFVSVRGLSLVAASRGHSSSRRAGLSLSRPLLLRSTGSRRTGSVVVAHGLSCSAACGIFPDQGSNPCPLPWQADSQPLRHQGSP